MTHNRRGFFGRLAAVFAAPVVAKLPTEPKLQRVFSVGERRGEVEAFVPLSAMPPIPTECPCAWTFKEQPCRYDGSESECDKSSTCCKKHGQWKNFGGRWL